MFTSFLFSQNTEVIGASLADNWNFCKYVTSKHYCENNESRLNCEFQIIFSENKYTLLRDSIKIDTGTFEINHQYDEVYFINFDSVQQGEILNILGISGVQLRNQEDGFTLFVEQTSDLYVLKK
ncbi:hypothetical protein [uncultured Aquimarina sp.]|uniref:hypothetical protein n=1 Tax=uncultured Aquimarina sp. TaxID=575652 RepID=UPI0026096531|nr:hypothetical protein [uncultured Aquimarina sp.]